MKPFPWLLIVLLLQTASRATPEIEDEFAQIQNQIASSKQWNRPRLAIEACRPEALIFENDHHPVPVVLRRTKALLKHLQSLPNPPELDRETGALQALEAELGPVANLNSIPAVDQRAFFQRITALRRQIAFKNPLLDFNAILFLKHNKQARGYRHMLDQYLGFNAEKSGGVFVLEQPFGPQPRVRNLLQHATVETGRLQGRSLDGQGSFVGLELDYDAQTVLFAFTEAEHAIPTAASYDQQYWRPSDIPRDPGAAHHFFRPENTYHIFSASLDGSPLRQLTDGMWNDLDPCFLPNGRIVFVSERAGGQVRCGMRPLPSGTLHAMMPDGTDLIQLSWHDTQEWQPSVNNDGLIAYTRWDYIDRDSDVAHHLWLCFPDGRDPRSLHGNYPIKRENRPWMELSIRAVPGSHRYVAVAAPHHGQAYGSIILIDPRKLDDRSTAQIQRVTPDTPFPESESAPGVPHPKGTHTPPAEFYGTPWPLDSDFFLCVYDSGQQNYGIHLLDTFGNRELLYRDPATACLDPIPLKTRPRPPVVPNATLQATADRPETAVPATGTVVVLNVYESELPLPENSVITELRVINIFPKDNPFQDDPNMGAASQSLGRGSLGTVPVEPDGSAAFQLPAGAPVYFQLLDQTGLAVQTMRSDTYVHPGETLTCIGCHENKQTAPSRLARTVPLALKRAPSQLQPESPGSYPLTFARLVQPVLNAQCLDCHNREPKAPSLRGDRFGKFGWSEAFNTLRPFAFGRSGGNGTAASQPQYSIPGKEGARASKLYALLLQDHYEVKLTAIDLRRITLWLDANSNFYAAYTDLQNQARGGIVQPKWGLPKWTRFEDLVGRDQNPRPVAQAVSTSY